MFVSAQIAIRQSASSAPQRDSGEIHSSCVVGRVLEVGRLLAVEAQRDDREPAGLEHLPVDRGDQRLGRRRALDQAGVALADLRRVADQDPGEVVDSRVAHLLLPRAARSRSGGGRGCHRHQQRVHARVLRELGVKRAEQELTGAHRHRVPVDLGEHLHAVADPLDPRGADEHGPQRLGADPSSVESASKLAIWRPKALRRQLDVDEPEVLAIAEDHPGAGAQYRAARLDVGADRRLEPVALDRLRDRRRLAAGDHEPVEVGERLGRADLDRVGAEPAQHPRVGGEVALAGEHADRAGAARSPSPNAALTQDPRCCSSSPWAASSAMSSPRIARRGP